MRRPPAALRTLRLVAAVIPLTMALPLSNANVLASSAPASPTSPTPPPARTPAKIGVVRVVLDEQRAYVYGTNRRLIATLLVSTGLRDSTPIGRFRVFSKSAETFYAPKPKERMRWMVRFVKDPGGGHIGFHSIPFTVVNGKEVKYQTPIGRSPSSKGCVRVRDEEAKWLYDNMSIGAIVIVQRTRHSGVVHSAQRWQGRTQ